MPTVDQPRYFEMGSLMPSKTDPFFKWASMDVEADHQTGDTEALCGFVTLLYIEAPAEIDEYLDQGGCDERDMLDNFIETGWYVTLQDDNGLIWTYEFGEGTLAEEHARREFAGSEAAYAAWAGDEDED